MTVVARKPLMLKEYLELDDDDSEYIAASGLAGGRVATTIRCLLDAELRCGEESLVPKERSGKKALTKFSTAIHAVKLLPFSSPDGRCLPSASDGSLPRSFSDRLRGSLWGKKKKKKKKKKEEKQDKNERAAEQQSAARLRDIMRIQSADANGEGWRALRFPSPVASSRSSWSETDSSGSDFLPASMASSESPHGIAASNSEQKLKKTAADDEELEAEAVERGPAKELESKVMVEEEEEEEQLSPVSVIDYPYQQGHGDGDENNFDEEADSTSATSPAFYRSLGSIERTKEQLIDRIRRFEMLAAHVDTIDLQGWSPSTTAEDPLESADHVASPDDEEEVEVRARDLLCELKLRPRGSAEKLLLDFFIQGLSREAGAEAAEMLNAARDWIDGRRCRELEDDHGEAALREMERNGRWRCFDEEEEDLAVYVEVSLLESLLEETVQDLTQC